MDYDAKMPSREPIDELLRRARLERRAEIKRLLDQSGRRLRALAESDGWHGAASTACVLAVLVSVARGVFA